MPGRLNFGLPSIRQALYTSDINVEKGQKKIPAGMISGVFCFPGFCVLPPSGFAAPMLCVCRCIAVAWLLRGFVVRRCSGLHGCRGFVHQRFATGCVRAPTFVFFFCSFGLFGMFLVKTSDH
jgi:hypothetical protein